MMNKPTLILTALATCALAVCAWVPARSSISPPPPLPATLPIQTAVLADIAPQVDVLPAPQEPAADEALASYLETSALAWVAKARGWKAWPDCTEKASVCASYEKNELESVEGTKARIKSIAHDIAMAAAVEKSPWTTDPKNARMAELVLTLGFEETLFRQYVDDGRCNDRAWRKTAEAGHLMGIGGTCDGTLAASIWQIHADDGILLLDSATDSAHRDWLNAFDARISGLKEDDLKNAEKLGNVATKQGIIHNRLLAARTAWHIARQALRFSKFENLCAYTGEWGSACPKAQLRLDFATKWWTTHPFAG